MDLCWRGFASRRKIIMIYILLFYKLEIMCAVYAQVQHRETIQFEDHLVCAMKYIYNIINPASAVLDNQLSPGI